MGLQVGFGMPGVAEIVILLIIAGIPLVTLGAIALFLVLRSSRQSGHSNLVEDLQHCVDCQATISTNAKFCSSCGKPQAV